MRDRIEQAGLATLRRMDPELAHTLALQACRYGLVRTRATVTSPRLQTDIAGLSLPNPVGLAAGFDKNAEALAALSQSGFGFLEVGAITPRPQPGNPKPRLFRLTEDRAVINRFGFNNQGMAQAARRLADRPKDTVLGLNLGANKDSDDRAADFSTVLQKCGALIDFATVNVSSPNTERLRDLQGTEALGALLADVQDTNAGLDTPVPIFLKIAPDLTDSDLAGVADTVAASRIDGIIATNTTLARDGLSSPLRVETGGLSGAPLFERSTRVVARLSEATGGNVAIIGVGGIASADDAYEKIRAGASAVQLYSALVYEGLGLVDRIARGLEARLKADGFARLADAVGTGRSDWL